MEKDLNNKSTKVTSKLNVGLRVSPEIKKQLTEKAESLGITLAEYTETIVLNYLSMAKENDRLQKEVNNLKEELIEKNEIIEEVAIKGTQFGEKLYQLELDLNKLKKDKAALENLLSISDEKYTALELKQKEELKALEEKLLVQSNLPISNKPHIFENLDLNLSW